MSAFIISAPVPAAARFWNHADRGLFHLQATAGGWPAHPYFYGFCSSAWSLAAGLLVPISLVLSPVRRLYQIEPKESAEPVAV